MDLEATSETLANESDSPRRLTPDGLPELARGDEVGRYVVISRVGAGGSGVVYRAYDPELDRAVAIKLVRSQPGRRERFLREAQALARLSHPNVIAVHDVGTVGDQVFLAMEYVEGSTLRGWLEGKRPLRKIVDVFLAAGRGLLAAHENGLVHRDFKPDNVLVGDDGRVRVVDFGLARFANVADETPTRSEDEIEIDTDRFLRLSLTQSGTMLGTPRYMAPEQHLRQATDARTDQFAFCVSLFEALYGARPFVSDTLEGLADAVIHGRISEPPAGSKVPARLRRILLRGLSVDPAQRYPDMATLLAALGRAHAAPRRRMLVAAVVGGVLAPCIALLAMGAPQREAKLSCPDAEQYLVGVWDPGVKQRVEAAFEHSRKPYAADTLQRVAGHLDQYARRWTRSRAEVCKASIAGDLDAQGSEVRTACLNRRLRSLGATADLLAGADEELIDQAVDAALGLQPVEGCDDDRLLAHGALLPRDPAARERIADLGRRLEQVRALTAMARYRPALELATGLLAEAEAQPYLPLQAEVHHEVGRILSLLSEIEQARPHLEQAARLAARVGDDGLAASALLDLQRDSFYSERLAGRSGESALALDVFVDAAFQRVGRQDALYAAYLMAAGEFRLRLERHDEARPYFEAALSLLEGQFGEHDVRVADALVELATALPPDRQNEGAELLTRALGIYEAIRGPMHPSVGETLNRIGNLAEDPDEMVAAYDRGLTIFADAFGASDWQVGRALNNSGEGLCEHGDVARGLERLERGLAIYEAAFGTEHCHLGYPLYGIASCHLQAGRPHEAIAPLERALSICGGQSLHATLVHDIEFQLAKALWKVDRGRSTALARAARVGYQATEGRSQKQLQEIDAWLATEGGPLATSRR